jgi:hypothetical protein
VKVWAYIEFKKGRLREMGTVREKRSGTKIRTNWEPSSRLQRRGLDRE